MNFNQAIILGRVTADPQLRTTPGGQSVVTLGVATNRTWTDKGGAKQEEAEFHNVVIWGRQAEVAAQFLKKGSTVLVEGRLRTREWKDKSGQDRRTTEIMADHIQLGPKPSPEGNKADKSPRKAPAWEPPAMPEKTEEEIKPEDIPF